MYPKALLTIKEKSKGNDVFFTQVSFWRLFLTTYQVSVFFALSIALKKSVPVKSYEF